MDATAKGKEGKKAYLTSYKYPVRAKGGSTEFLAHR